jgi:hypothetical protein
MCGPFRITPSDYPFRITPVGFPASRGRHRFSDQLSLGGQAGALGDFVSYSASRGLAQAISRRIHTSHGKEQVYDPIDTQAGADDIFEWPNGERGIATWVLEDGERFCVEGLPTLLRGQIIFG